mmetsp:Transcript_3147/g.2713  ORF Transcript_3147/g.2713 Transcript_3147/m.2713 type:complete len:146 (+) Transcript_3147:587-1024(+)
MKIKDLIEKTVGMEMESGIINFFRDKSMLIIFDDFDLFYTKEMEFPRHLLITLKEQNIPCIFVTSKQKKTEGKKKPSKEVLQDQEQKKTQIENELGITEDSKFRLKNLQEEDLSYLLASYLKPQYFINDHLTIEKIQELKHIKLS